LYEKINENRYVKTLKTLLYHAAASLMRPLRQHGGEAMTVLKSLVLYWYKDGGTDNFKVPSLEDILEYRPYPAYVNLFAARLIRDRNRHVGIDMPDTISRPLYAGVVRRLQDAGIKVVLSILNAEDKKSVGWSTMTTDDNAYLANKIRELHEGSDHFDGIDIDDEYMDVRGTAENFYNTVHAIRSIFPNLVISNPIYRLDEDGDKYKYKPFPKSPSLAELMTYCATMNYGNDLKYIIKEVKAFNKLGIPKEKLYAGVYPGPVDSKGNLCAKLRENETETSWTSIEAAEEVAKWAKTNCAGVMIFTYSTDTDEYAGCPRPKESERPNKEKDHRWQKAITSVLTAK
jgi:Glycosyl hydrolases family 18